MIILRVDVPGISSPSIYKIKSFPCSIGRSIVNTIVISNDSVSGEHIVIEQDIDNDLILTDLNSTNGITVNGVKQKKVVLRNNVNIILGEVLISVHLEDEHLEKTRIVELPNNFKKNNQKNIILLIISMFFLLLIESYFNDPITKTRSFDLLWEFLVIIGCSSFFSFIFSFINKIQTKRYNYKQYFFLTILLINALVLLSLCSNYLSFEVNNRNYYSFISSSLYILTFYFYFQQSLFVFFNRKLEKIISLYLVIFFLLTGGLYFLSLNFNEKRRLFEYKTSYIYTKTIYTHQKYSRSRLNKNIEDSINIIERYRKEMNNQKDENKRK